MIKGKGTKRSAKSPTKAGETKEPASRRRFPRILVQPPTSPLQTLLGASAIWPGGEHLDVYDLSYSGAALSLSSLPSVKPGDEVELGLTLAGQRAFKVKARVVRLAQNLMAVDFRDFSTEARLAVERFMQDKLIGANVRAIDPRFFNRDGGFTHWFHGPLNTNIFLWYDKGQMYKATVEFGSQLLIWDDNVFSEGSSSEYSFEAEDYVRPLLKTKATQIPPGFSPLMARVLEVLTQIPDTDGVLKPLIAELSGRR
jgi:hypothetical protein